MATPDETDQTCWSMIERAANGRTADRSRFAEHYLDVVLGYLRSRWRNTALVDSIDDAGQEVFLECFQGALERADRDRGSGFRGYLFGITRNVAARHETARANDLASADTLHLASLRSREDELTLVFERAWARTLVKDAHKLLLKTASRLGDAATRRVEILRRRFAGDVSMADLAAELGITTKRCYKDFEQAREDFRSCLRDTVRFHSDDPDLDIDAECHRVLGLLHERPDR